MKRCLFFFFAILLFQKPLPAAEQPDAETLGKLLAGEILLLDARSDEAGGSARVQVLVDASAESVWEVIVSCAQSFVFLYGLRLCEVFEENPPPAFVNQVVKKGWLVPTQDFRFESLRRPYREITFRLVSGNLKSMHGSWQFSELPQGLLVDYEIHVRSGLPVPGFIVSYVMRKGMPDLIACIRGLAGGSGSVEHAQADLGRCRGQAAKP
jgi:ribosome-associated toxin RatA of RatAB toxin-antitoxin module